MQPPVEPSHTSDPAAIAAGDRLTAPRKRVLDVLMGSGRPMKAYDILSLLSQGGVRTHPPTVYRALDYLVEAGLVHRVETTSAYVVCDASSHHHAHPMLVCDACGRVEEAAGKAAAQALADVAAASGFAIARMILEARGTCSACAARPALQDVPAS